MTAPSRKMSPFEFRSDFETPESNADPAEGVMVSARELALLLEESRQKGMAMVENARKSEADEAVANLHSQLNAAMDDLVALTRFVETAAERSDSAVAREARAVSSRIVDGQGELFSQKRPTGKTHG